MRAINNSGRPDNKNPVKKYSFTVRDRDAAQRLDQAIPVYLKDISREKAKKLIQIGAVWVNKKRVQILSRKVFMGDTVTIYFFQDGWKKSYDINPDNILHEDQWLIFYRKEPGIPTQGLQWDNYNNLYSALFRYMKKINPMPYVGMHHRLDTDTSGVVLFTVSDKINTSIHNQFKSRLAKKHI